LLGSAFRAALVRGEGAAGEEEEEDMVEAMEVVEAAWVRWRTWECPEGRSAEELMVALSPC